mgnify:CR=1 FL=1
MCNVVTGMDARTQVRNEALQLENSITLIGFWLLKGVGSCGGGSLIDLHRLLIVCIWLVHVTHDELSGAFEITIALAQGSGRLLIREAHASEHHQ